MINLILGDCLEKMKEIPDGSVDLILTDPPYGTAGGMGKGLKKYKNINSVEWDKNIDENLMLRECNRILRVNGMLILFSQEPYTSKLITNSHKNLPFCYKMIWLKDHFSNCLLVNKAPVNYTEDICVFFKKYDTLGQHPLREYSKKIMDFVGANLKKINSDLGHRRAEHFFYINSTQFKLCTKETYDELIEMYQIDKMEEFKQFEELVEIDFRFSRHFNLSNGRKYKSNVLHYKKDYDGFHPTQKPVKLLKDLIRTYTNEGDIVLDFTMGSGSTGVACKNLNRSFIGIELDENYFKIAKERIEKDEIDLLVEKELNKK